MVPIKELYSYQKEAIENLKNGSVLCGGVGSGKSFTAIGYYMKDTSEEPRDLYIITTAKKRDDLEWEKELSHFLLSTHSELCCHPIKVVVDSWNNIKKYKNIYNSFFIFDEQRVVGTGVWVKSFLNITRKNKWILLSATPGDTWQDYVPLFIANGFFKNKTEFERQHVIFARYSKYPKVEGYMGNAYLEKLRRSIVVMMADNRTTETIDEYLNCSYDITDYKKVFQKRWNIFQNKPIKTIAEMCYLLRKVCNSDESRINNLEKIYKRFNRVIVFYNFDYELELILQKFKKENVKQWNGHKHEPVPETKRWLYLVQYAAGSEAWNCIKTNCIFFYSLNYSYKTMTQAKGRIDRIDTPFEKLFYFFNISKSPIDNSIRMAIKNKKNFNERLFLS